MDGRRVLVIEDQEDLAELYASALAEEGFRVTKAYTGEEGIAFFEDEGADVIVLDVTLPEMNGVQVLQKIRDRDTKIPVVVATGETNDETRQQCQRLGVQEYMEKPVKSEALTAALHRALNDPKTATEEYEVVTLRLSKRIIECLTGIDQNLDRAVEMLCAEKMKA